MLVQPSADGSGIDVRLGDAGGFPGQRPSRGSTLDEALAAAEIKAQSFLESSKRLQQDLCSGNLADIVNLDELKREEFIRVAGWPPVPNPHFQK